MAYEQDAEHIYRLLGERLGVRGSTLEARLLRAGRLLPRSLRREGQLLVDALKMEASPRLSKRIDHEAVQRAVKALAQHLSSIDARKRRFDRAVGITASIAFSLIVVIAGVIAVAYWRHLI